MHSAAIRFGRVSRAAVYAHQKPKPVDECNLLLSRLSDSEYARHPFYGSRKMEALRSVGQSGIKAHRPHQSLGHNTFDIVHQTVMGGRAMILDKYPRSVEEPTAPPPKRKIRYKRNK